jgi:Dolichyl-phosphate-mannose-protein mannosyltransferase
VTACRAGPPSRRLGLIASGPARRVPVRAQPSAILRASVSKRLLLALGIVLAAVLLGSCLRGYAMLLHKQLAHDEAVTYLAATGHMGAWEQAVNGGLNGRWEPVGVWKKLIEPGPFWDFGSIRSDLAHYDNHPPLYFWLLHVWIAAFGLTLNSGILLNIAIAFATGFLLFGFARTVLRNDLLAATVPAVWTLSPPVLATAMQARQYDLLAFFAVGFAWLLTWLTAERTRLRWWALVLLALATAGGLLTHYHFFLVLLGGGVFAALRLWRVDRRRLAWLTGAALAGVAIFAAGQPLFYLSLEHQTGQAATPTWHDFTERLGNVVSGVAAFFGTSDAAFWLIGFGVLAIAAAGAVLLRRRRVPSERQGEAAEIYSSPRPLAEGAAAAPPPHDESGVPRGDAAAVGDGAPAGRTPAGLSVPSPRVWLQGRLAPALFFLCWNGGATVLLYLAFRSPLFAMHDRYLAAVWPFLAFVPALLAGVFGRWRALAVGLFCLAVLLPGSIVRMDSYTPKTPDPVPSFRRAQHFVIAGVTRGNLTRVLWHIPADKQVFVDSQQAMYQEKDKWLPHLVTRDVFVFDLGDPQDPAIRREMLSWLTARFPFHRQGTVWGLFEFWRVYPKAK